MGSQCDIKNIYTIELQELYAIENSIIHDFKVTQPSFGQHGRC